MFRIAHISDLHLEDSQCRKKDETLLQWLAKLLGKALFETEINERKYNAGKLVALKNIFRWLQPDLIVVTGDLTNLGDAKSFQMVIDTLEELKKTANAKKVFCIPGNHDSLVERAYYLRRTWKGKLLVGSLAKFSAVVDALAKLSRQLSKRPENDADNPHLRFYCENIEPLYGEVDPSKPRFVEMDGVEIALFLFNSTNESSLMVNEGHIGQQQFNALNKVLQDPAQKVRLSHAVRIALLHHHPVSAPAARGSAVGRAYNWMRDGPHFVEYMNRREFHFILHGHEHEPFQCSINYQENKEHGLGVHILAAGSALQGDEPNTGSFNVLDILNPFEARLRRFNHSASGYNEKKPEADFRLPIQPISKIRLSGEEGPETPADVAIRNLTRGRDEGIDENNHYALLEFKAAVKKDQLYIGNYRRVGEVMGSEPDAGPVFVITGSPRMKWDDMNWEPLDTKTKTELRKEKVFDYSHQKGIRVLHKQKLRHRESFDITLGFHWQATDAEPNHFGAINLWYFRRGVDRLRFEVQLPWEPVQPSVTALGIESFEPELLNQKTRPKGDGTYVYSFEIKNPPLLVYLIKFGPPQ